MKNKREGYAYNCCTMRTERRPIRAGVIMIFNNQNRSCHAERSEASRGPSRQTLRFAQGDKSFLILLVKTHHHALGCGVRTHAIHCLICLDLTQGACIHVLHLIIAPVRWHHPRPQPLAKILPKAYTTNQPEPFHPFASAYLRTCNNNDGTRPVHRT